MYRTPLLPLFGILLGALPLHAQTPLAEPPSRGQLLYETHCIACHTTQVHWRDQRLVSDYPNLVAQVVRWQGNTGLGWTGEEVREVARYLDATFYHLPDAPPPKRG
jgi:mono/diheme cytochrome c family protein